MDTAMVQLTVLPGFPLVGSALFETDTSACCGVVLLEMKSSPIPSLGVESGSDAATNVNVEDVLPNGHSYVAASIGGGDSSSDAGAPTLSWSITSLASLIRNPGLKIGIATQIIRLFEQNNVAVVLDTLA